LVKHISAMVSDKDVIAYLDGLPNQSEFIRDCVIGVIRGDYVRKADNISPLNAAKLKGVEYDNVVKRARAERAAERQELEIKRIRTDIELKGAQLQLSEAAIAKLTAPRGGTYRYILAWRTGEIKFICPHCAITVAEPTSYGADNYIEAKQKLINHMADKHEIHAYSFDRYTNHYFRDFELRFFGQEIPACPNLDAYHADKYFAKIHEWPGPAKALPGEANAD